MLSNYFTLQHCAWDLNARLSGRALSAAFSQSKNELVLGFNNDSSLVVSCEPARNALFLRDAFSRARKNSLDFFSEARGGRVISAYILPADREIVIALENRRFVHLQLYGSKANVYLTDEQRRILDAFLRPRESIGRVLDEPHPALPALSDGEFESRVQAIGHLPAFAVLKNIHPLYGSVLVREVFHRAGVNDQKKVIELHQSEIRRIYTASREVQAELMVPSPRIYFEQEEAVLFSLIDLRSCANFRAEPFDSIHEAIRLFLQTSRRRKGLLEEKTGLETRLSAELERLERTLAKMALETAAAERIAQYELYGKLLKASLHRVNKGVDAVVLENMFSPAREELEIPLDPHLTGARNADRYFAKAKKARHSLEEAGKRREDLHERYDLLKRLSDELKPVQTPEAWEAFWGRWRDALVKAGFESSAGSRTPEPLPPFRLFTVEGGFQVWAGKDSRNNDLLTMKHARPNDLWFHARGSGGSHVVLRVGSGKGEVSKRAIEQAAAIAAYYSKMKSSRLVPVAMTHRKYVRKPRGAPAGTVAIEREKVLLVEPRLPGDRDHG